MVYRRSHLARRRNLDFDLLKDTFQRRGGKISGKSNMPPSSSSQSFDELRDMAPHEVGARVCNGGEATGSGFELRLRSCCGWSE